jgi:hypothetical protein
MLTHARPRTEVCRHCSSRRSRGHPRSRRLERCRDEVGDVGRSRLHEGLTRHVQLALSPCQASIGLTWHETKGYVPESPTDSSLHDCDGVDFD